jgi:nitrogen regulatory protein PII
MKDVEEFIRHEAFEPIRGELLQLGFPSLSITAVESADTLQSPPRAAAL